MKITEYLKSKIERLNYIKSLKDTDYSKYALLSKERRDIEHNISQAKQILATYFENKKVNYKGKEVVFNKKMLDDISLFIESNIITDDENLGKEMQEKETTYIDSIKEYQIVEEDALDDLIKNNPDKEKDLLDIKKNLTIRSQGFAEEESSFENEFENHAENLNYDVVKKYIEENDYGEIFSFSNGRTPNVENYNEKTTNLYKETKFVNSTETKDALKEILKQMEEAEMLYIKEDSINGEERTKVYSFGRLVKQRNLIQKAIKEKNIDEAIIQNNKYNEIYKKYEDLLNYIDEKFGVDGHRMPGNMSSAREQTVPQEFAERQNANAVLNGIYVFWVSAKNYGVNPLDVIEDPNVLVNKIVEKKQERFNEIFKKEGITQAQQLTQCLAEQDLRLDYSIGRPFELLQKLELNDEYRANNLIYSIFASEKGLISDKNGITERFFDNSGIVKFDNLRNYIAYGHMVDLEEFQSDMINPKKLEKYESKMDYMQYVVAGDIDLNKEYDRVMGLLAETSVEMRRQNKENNVQFILTMDQVAVSTAQYFSDIILYKGLDKGDPFYDKAMKFIKDPSTTFRDILVEKKFKGIKINYTQEFVDATQKLFDREKFQDSCQTKEINLKLDKDINADCIRLSKEIKNIDKQLTKLEKKGLSTDELSQTLVKKMNELNDIVTQRIEMLQESVTDGNIPKDYMERRINQLRRNDFSSKLPPFFNADRKMNKKEYLSFISDESLSKDDKNLLYENYVTKFRNGSFKEEVNELFVHNEIAKYKDVGKEDYYENKDVKEPIEVEINEEKNPPEVNELVEENNILEK